MAFFFDLYTFKSFFYIKHLFQNINYYINDDKNLMLTVYFEEDEYNEMLDFVNKIILFKNIKIETFYTEQGHFLYCTKEYEKKEIDFLNFKTIILKNITSQPETIQKLVKKIDKNRRFITNI